MLLAILNRVYKQQVKFTITTCGRLSEKLTKRNKNGQNDESRSKPINSFQ